MKDRLRLLFKIFIISSAIILQVVSSTSLHDHTSFTLKKSYSKLSFLFDLVQKWLSTLPVSGMSQIQLFLLFIIQLLKNGEQLSYSTWLNKWWGSVIANTSNKWKFSTSARMWLNKCSHNFTGISEIFPGLINWLSYHKNIKRHSQIANKCQVSSHCFNSKEQHFF